MDNHPDTSSPRRILLASDLTSRGDRALDRAAQLARHWGAELHLVHAIQTAPPPIPLGVNPDDYLRRYPDGRDDALRVIERDLGAGDLGAIVHLEDDSRPAAAILGVCERAECDLIVVGESRERWFGPIVESTIEQVVRSSPVSVLLVRDRPREPYRQLLVGTDYTDEAMQALVFAAVLFPDAAMSVLHAFTLPYAFLLDAAAEGSKWAVTQLANVQDHIASAPLSEARKAGIRGIVESGPPGAMLRRYAQTHACDLTVIGAHARGVLFDAAIGNSRRILSSVPGDVLMVRAARASSAQ